MHAAATRELVLRDAEGPPDFEYVIGEGVDLRGAPWDCFANHSEIETIPSQAKMSTVFLPLLGPALLRRPSRREARRLDLAFQHERPAHEGRQVFAQQDHAIA